MGIYNSVTRFIRPWSSLKYTQPLKRHYEEAFECFKGLLAVPVRRGCILRLIVGLVGNPDEKFAEVLAPFVYDMKEKGWKVIMMGTTIDFGVSREEWDKKVRANSAFVGTIRAGATSSISN
jgi:hypothetical protein